MIKVILWGLVVGCWAALAVVSWSTHPATAVIAYLVCAFFAAVEMATHIRREIDRLFSEEQS